MAAYTPLCLSSQSPFLLTVPDLRVSRTIFRTPPGASWLFPTSLITSEKEDPFFPFFSFFGSNIVSFHGRYIRIQLLCCAHYAIITNREKKNKLGQVIRCVPEVIDTQPNSSNRRFRRLILNANGHTNGQTYGYTDGHYNGQDLL